MLVEADAFISQRAREIYPLVYNCKKEEKVPEFYEFVIQDIKSFVNQTVVKDDISVANLTSVEMISIYSLGLS